MPPPPPPGPADRDAQIRRIVEQTLDRRAAGTPEPDDRVIAANPGLMPELGDELRLLHLIEIAREESTDPHPSVPDLPDDHAEADHPGLPLFPGYRTLRAIDRGGQGTVYEAVQLATSRRVAIKLMREAEFPERSDDAVRFRREVRVLAHLEHPNLVGVLGTGFAGRRPFLVLEYIDGVPLDQHVAATEPPLRARVRLIEKVCQAVAAAHVRGIIHRDLKPANVLIDDRGEPRVLDFGLARILTDDDGHFGPDLARSMTGAGQFVGSLAWSSPEQAAGNLNRIDLRADVYAIGLLLYALLTGRMPYPTDGGVPDTLRAIAQTPPTRPSTLNRAIDADLETVLLKCLSKDPDGRYRSAGELGDDLNRYLESRTILARPPSRTRQARAFVRRNRALVLGLVATLAALAIGLATTTSQLRRARRAEAAATKSADDAKASLTRAEREAYSARISAAAAAVTSHDAAGALAQLNLTAPALRAWEWQYLHQRADMSVGVLPAPESPFGCVAASPDGRIVLEGTQTTLSGVNPATNSVIWQVPHAPMLPPVFSPDGSCIAVPALPEVVILNASTGAVLHRNRVMDLPRPCHFAISPDLSLLAVVIFGDQGGLQVYRIADWFLIFQDDRRMSANGSVEFDPEGRRLLTSTFQELTVYQVPRDLSGDAPPSPWPVLDRWKLGDGDLGSILDFAFLRVPPWPDHPPSHPTDPLPRGLIAVAHSENLVLIDSRTGQRCRTLHGHTGLILSIAQSADDAYVATGSTDQTVRIWDLTGAKSARTLTGFRGGPTSLAFAGPDHALFSASPGDIQRRRWAGGFDGPEPRRSLVLGGAGNEVNGIQFTRDSRTMFVAGGNRLGRLRIDQVDRTDPVDFNANPAFALDPTGTRLVEATAGTGLRVWDVNTMEVQWHDPAPDGGLHDQCRADWSADGATIAVSSSDGTVHVWDAHTNAHLRAFKAHDGMIERLRFSPDSKRLITAGHDHTASVWSMPDGAAVSTSRAHSGLVRDANFSPDGRTAASVGDDGNACLWDATTASPIRTFRVADPPPAQTGVWAVAFGPDGRLATGGADGAVRLWDADSGQLVLNLDRFGFRCICLAWSPDGRALAAGGSDGQIMLWDSQPVARPDPTRIAPDSQPPASHAAARAAKGVSTRPSPDSSRSSPDSRRFGPQFFHNLAAFGMGVLSLDRVRNDPDEPVPEPGVNPGTDASGTKESAVSRTLAGRCLAMMSILSASAAAARAQTTATFTSDATIGAGNTQYEGQQVIVKGCTLTIDGEHAFHSMRIERNAGNVAGRVTHSPNTPGGLHVNLTTDLVIQGPGLRGDPNVCRIDVSGKGYPAAQGPGSGTYVARVSHAGGGGHGSPGRNSLAPVGVGGPAYGNPDAPTTAGSGGGNPNGGGAGGGIVRIIAGGEVVVDGAILAAGLSGTGTDGGGGAGGSIWITAQTISGGGYMTVVHGSGCCSYAGGGAGGRARREACSITGPAFVVVGDGGTVTQSTPQPPAIIVQPQSLAICSSSTASMTVAALGTTTGYQWRKSGINLANGGHVSGVNSAVLQFTGISADDAGSYDCVVSNHCSSAAAAAATLAYLTPACPADFDRNGQLQPADVSTFISEWFAELNAGCQ